MNYHLILTQFYLTKWINKYTIDKHYSKHFKDIGYSLKNFPFPIRKVNEKPILYPITYKYLNSRVAADEDGDEEYDDDDDDDEGGDYYEDVGDFVDVVAQRGAVDDEDADGIEEGAHGTDTIPGNTPEHDKGLVNVGQMTLSHLNDTKIISIINHEDMRDTSNAQNPSICRGIGNARKQKLFTPLFKSSKGSQYGPGAECGKIYKDCFLTSENDGTGESLSEDVSVEKIGERFCTEFSSLGDELKDEYARDECLNVGDSICSTVALPKNLHDKPEGKRKEVYRVPGRLTLPIPTLSYIIFQ